MSEATIYWLTLLGIGLPVLTSIFFLNRKLFGYLAQLDELPQIKESIDELRDQSATQHIQNVTRMTTLEGEVRSSQRWHDEHLMREHGQQRNHRNRSGHP